MIDVIRQIEAVQRETGTGRLAAFDLRAAAGIPGAVERQPQPGLERVAHVPLEGHDRVLCPAQPAGPPPACPR